jgi:hypothetical protein
VFPAVPPHHEVKGIALGSRDGKEHVWADVEVSGGKLAQSWDCSGGCP